MASIYDALLNPEGTDQERNRAMVAALKRQQDIGLLGTLMGVEPTMQAGENLQKGAQISFGEAMQQQAQARQAAARNAELAQQQKNWDMNFRQQANEFAIQQRAQAAQEQRLREQMEQDQYQLVADPVYGGFVKFNKKTGEGGPYQMTPQTGQQGGGVSGFEKMPPGIKIPESASKYYLGASMLAENVPRLESLIGGGYTPSKADTLAVGPPQTGIAGQVQQYVPREMADARANEFFTVGGKVLTAILRPESGGAVTPDEWTQYGPMYLPWPGDSKQQREAKLASLRSYMDRLASSAGPASRYYTPPARGAAGAPQGSMPQSLPRPGDKYMTEDDQGSPGGGR